MPAAQRAAHAHLRTGWAHPGNTAGRLTVLAAAMLLVAAAEAHHGSADYDVTREIAVTGTVKEWRWSNPHTWFLLAVNAPGGQQEWSGEGPPLNWAEARGWSKTMFTAGETVTLFIYPSRRDPRGGLVTRIQRRNGEVVLVSRPWLDRQ